MNDVTDAEPCPDSVQQRINLGYLRLLRAIDPELLDMWLARRNVRQVLQNQQKDITRLYVMSEGKLRSLSSLAESLKRDW